MKFVLVDPNAQETIAQAKQYLQKTKLTLPFYRIANASFVEWLAVSSTPSFYVFDNKDYLRYAGTMEVGARGTKEYTPHLMNAIADLLAGRPVATKTTYATG